MIVATLITGWGCECGLRPLERITMSIASKETLRAFAITAAIGTAAVVLATFRSRQANPQETPPEPLPSITSIQLRFNELEPENPLKLDGKLGRATQEKWDRVFMKESEKAAFDEVAKAKRVKSCQ